MKLIQGALVAGLAFSPALGCSKKEPTPAPQATQEPATPEAPPPKEVPPSPAEHPAPDAEAGHEAAPDAAPDAAQPAAVAPAGDGKNTLGFSPAANGFKFPNYGNEPGIINLTAVEVRRMFGDKACASIDNGTCLLTPPARAWMEELNKSMGGGHCEGFAAVSLLAHAGKLPGGGLGGDVATLELNNERLQREIAYWFATQATAPTRTAEIKDMTPSQVVTALAASFATGTTGELYTMGIYKREYKEGHAITPYGLKDLGEGKTGVLVYDNNYPGEERVIEVDTGANTWKYSASTNPNEPASLYEGDATTFTLTLTPSSKRLEPQQCAFCDELAVGADATGEVKGSAGGAVKTCDVWLDGDADVFVTDAEGRRLGTVDGALVSEIPGGTAVALKSALWQDDHEPIYSVPVGKMVITIDGSKVTTATSSDVSLIGPAFTFGVEDISLDPGQKDEVHISQDMRTIVYKTSSQETPVLELGITTSAADYHFAIKVVGEADGQEIELAVDPVKGELRFAVRGHEGDTAYGIELVRIDDKGESTFTHEGISLADDAAITLVYGEWKGQGTDLPARLDKGSDGSVDESLTFTDAQ